MKERASEMGPGIKIEAKPQASKDEIIKNNLDVFVAFLIVIRDSADRSKHPEEVFESGEETLHKVFCKDSKPKNKKR